MPLIRIMAGVETRWFRRHVSDKYGEGRPRYSTESFKVNEDDGSYVILGTAIRLVNGSGPRHLSGRNKIDWCACTVCTDGVSGEDATRKYLECGG